MERDKLLKVNTDVLKLKKHLQVEVQGLKKDLLEANYKLSKALETSALKNKLYEKSVSMIGAVFDSVSITPTMNDKPSSKSSLDHYLAIKKLQMIFPEPMFRVFYVENTNSMEPFIDQNSVVACERLSSSVLKKQPLSIGDICLYKSKGLYIIHRITKYQKKGMEYSIDHSNNRGTIISKKTNFRGGSELYYFVGDNNKFGDGWVRPKAIEYRYVSQIQTSMRGD